MMKLHTPANEEVTIQELALRRTMVPLDDVRLQVVQAGPPDGAPLLLLHGFPEFWYGWRAQLAALPGRGVRVIAPDQRGYNRSDKPVGVEAYSLPILAKDVLDLLDALELERVVLAGHDWGGEVAWWFALQHPERLRHLVALAAPHPMAMSRALRAGWRQKLRSSYMLFFQLPWLPEKVLGAAGGNLLARAMQRSRRQGRFSKEELRRYRGAWRQPDALRCMLHWYRALRQHPPALPGLGRVQVPTTIWWGEQDPFFPATTFERSGNYSMHSESQPLADTGHWLQHERAEQVNSLLEQLSVS